MASSGTGDGIVAERSRTSTPASTSACASTEATIAPWRRRPPAAGDVDPSRAKT
jgi:hypothetical protein